MRALPHANKGKRREATQLLQELMVINYVRKHRQQRNLCMRTLRYPTSDTAKRVTPLKEKSESQHTDG